jgi:hypothetical protein
MCRILESFSLILLRNLPLHRRSDYEQRHARGKNRSPSQGQKENRAPSWKKRPGTVVVVI